MIKHKHTNTDTDKYASMNFLYQVKLSRYKYVHILLSLVSTHKTELHFIYNR